MPSFVPGDRVRIPRANGLPDYRGVTGTVIEATEEFLRFGPHGDQVAIRPDSPRFEGDEGYWWDVDDLELIDDDLEGLRREVSRLRAQGIKVSVQVEQTTTVEI